jgi:hypothetical protein
VESVNGATENSPFTQNTAKLTGMEADCMDMKNLLQFLWISVIYIMSMRQGYFPIYNVAKPSLFREFCHGGTKSKQWVTALLAFSADGSDKLPPLITGKYKSPHCLKNLKRLPIKYKSNTNSQMTTSHS